MMTDISVVIEAFTEITQHVIKTIAPIEMERGEPLLSEQCNLTAEVSGILGFTGDSVMSLSVSFTKDAITKIYRVVFPEESDAASIFQMADMVGEITNMIAGNFKNYTSELDMKFESSIPTVVIGSQRFYHPAGSINRLLPFYVEGSLMFLELSIRTS